MLMILPAGAYLFSFLLLREKGLDWRRSALAGAVFWGVCVALSTEVLSVFSLVSRGPVAVFWGVVCAACFLYWRLLRRNPRARAAAQSGSVETLPASLKLLLAATGFVVLLVAIVGLVAPPSTWDAMLYHLPRVTMWMSNRSVRFFPTPDVNQLIFGPWAEYAMLHTCLLWGGDRFVNWIEFFSLVGSAIGASLIAQRLGAAVTGQALAAVISATIPEGLLESSGAMNTYVVSFWIVATVVFLLDWNEDHGWLNTLCVGFSAGLAILTKGIALVYLPPLVISCWWMGSPSKRVLFLKRSGAFLVAILAINSAQFIRCYQFAGTPLGVPLPFPYPRVEVTALHVSVRSTVASVLRNLSLHLGTFGDTANSHVEHIVRLAIRGIGANPDDPGAIWLGDTFHVNRFSLHEIYAGNPLQLILLLGSVAIIVWKWREAGLRKASWYACGILGGFVFLCATLLWNMWSSRLHLPFFVLGAALVGFTIARYASPSMAVCLAGIVVAWALPYAAMNRIRSLIPVGPLDSIYHARSDMYFYDQHKSFIPATLAAADAINHLDCDLIAIDSYVPNPAIGHSPKSLYVYPLLALIHAGGRGRRVRYSGVQNPTIRFETGEDRLPACAVICFDCASQPEKWDEYRRIGGRVSLFDYIAIFSSAGVLPNVPASRPIRRF